MEQLHDIVLNVHGAVACASECESDGEHNTT